MDILTHAFAAIWQVLVVGLLLGAGLPALFALGMRSLSAGRMAGADGHLRTDAPPVSALGRIGAVLCFGLVIVAALFGLVVIVFGDRAIDAAMGVFS
ncbi:MAG TPA: hypothetical protein VGB53_09175 [Rubricoccaceae bacterium]|jgi:hypothetical protein